LAIGFVPISPSLNLRYWAAGFIVWADFGAIGLGKKAEISSLKKP
jgi:hypothetical protein